MRFFSSNSRPLFAAGVAALLAAGALTSPGCGSPKATPKPAAAANVANAPKPAPVAAAVAPKPATSIRPAAIAKISYNQHIQPILAENCFACHGPDSASRKGKLRLDRFEFATAKRDPGYPAIVPGKL